MFEIALSADPLDSIIPNGDSMFGATIEVVDAGAVVWWGENQDGLDGIPLAAGVIFHLAGSSTLRGFRATGVGSTLLVIPDSAPVDTVPFEVLSGAAAAVTYGLTNTQLRATAVPVSDAGAAWVSALQTTTSADMTGAADLTAAPTAGQKIVVDDVVLSADTAMYVDFLEETSGTLMFRLYVAAGGTAQFSPRAKLKLPVADKRLRGDASAAGNVAVLVLYHSEA